MYKHKYVLENSKNHFAKSLFKQVTNTNIGLITVLLSKINGINGYIDLYSD